jgi:hypothetical protein
MFIRLWIVSLIVFGSACVDTLPPVDRTQGNITRKTDLLGGEWYFLQTVVDTPYTASFTFAGESGELSRIEWAIERDYLVARRAYENVAGADPEGINGSEDAAGAPVAMYAIESHFDIRRQYNPVTGEELNVIEENTTDRPWQDRDFIRVNWGENLIQNPDFLMIQRYFDGVRASPVAWHIEDPNDPNAPVFVREREGDAASPLVYMDVTNKMFVEPLEVDIPGLGRVASCILMQFEDGYPEDCAPAEITVRSSFMRVEDDRDYQPLVYTGDRMDRAGYFITERPGYDPSYGLVEPLRYRFANRHDLWQASHRRVDGEIMTCVADADCDDGRGSVCDLDWGRSRRQLRDGRIEGACTIAYRDREAKPIVYHATPNYPESLLPELAAIQSEWNRAFVEVVGSVRENECLTRGGSDCAAERTRADAQQMYYVCRTPVAEGDPAACGAAGTTARIGDLRFSLLGYVNEPHRSSPLGYGPSAADPLTGEIVSGTAFIYGAGVESYAAMGRDIVRLLNGDLDEADLAAGMPVRDFVDRMSATDGETGEHAHVVPIDGDDVERLAAAMDFSWAHRGSEATRPQSAGEAIERIHEATDRILDSQEGLEGAGALARLEGTDIERLLTGREELAMASIDPDTAIDDDVIERASPLRGLRPDRVEALERARLRLQAGAGIDHGDFADEGLLGLARAIRRAADEGGTIEWNGVVYPLSGEGGIDYEAVREMLRHPILTGLALHEVGHTLGLRHNFSGSYDAPNYAPEYWQLRDDGTMRPRAWDPMSDAEHDGRITEHAYSTVMDYGQNFIVTDSNGIGHYDVAAIKLGYGDLVEVFTDVPHVSEVSWLAFIQSRGWPAPITFQAASGRGPLAAYTYTDWPSLVGGREALESRVDVPYTSLTVEPFLMRSGITDVKTVDSQMRVVVPYRFCSDEQADLSPGCYRYDSGADPYESVQSIADSYWNYYIFNNFRRFRIGFNVEDTTSRIMGRYFRKLQRANQSYALWRGTFTDVFDAPESFFTAERGMGSYTLAAGAAYQLFTRVIASPEPGGYAEAQRGDGTAALVRGAGAVDVDGFDGRFLETTWDFDAGYFWFDQLSRVGFFYDKILAIQALTDPTTYFIGRDTDSDIRRYQLNFATTFGPSVTRFVGGLLGDDWGVVAPRVVDGIVRYPDALQIANGSMPGTPLAPNAGFSVQLYAAVYGMTLIPQTYDQDFIHRSRVWVEGGAEEVEIDPSLPTVRFTDASSGLTYVAISYPDASGERGSGAQMILHAQALAARAATDANARAELDSFMDNLDLVRRLSWRLGFGAQP